MQLAVRARHWGSLHDVRTLKLKQLNGLQSFVVVLFTCASPDETCQHVLGSLNTETTPLLFLHTCKNKFYLLWRMNPTHTGYQIMTFIFFQQWFVFLFFYYNQPNIFGFEDFSDKSHKLKTSAWGFGKISETYATAFWCPNIWSVIQEKISSSR